MKRAITPIDHTGDVAFDLTADDLDTLFDTAREALVFAMFVTEPTRWIEDRTVRGHRRIVLLDAPELDVLLVRWLEEVRYLVESEAVLAVAAEPRVERQGNGWRLTAVVRLAPLAPEARKYSREVKAVTYHGLEVARTEEGWRARVVFDV